MEHLPTLLSPQLTHHTLPDGESSHPQSLTWTHSLSLKFSLRESMFKGTMLDNYLNCTTTLASSPFPQQETSTSQPHPVQCAPPLLHPLKPPRADWQSEHQHQPQLQSKEASTSLPPPLPFPTCVLPRIAMKASFSISIYQYGQEGDIKILIPPQHPGALFANPGDSSGGWVDRVPIRLRKKWVGDPD